jgi:hypothetical protein
MIILIKMKIIYFKDITDEDDSLQKGLPFPFTKTYEPEYNIKDFFNIIPGSEIKDIEIDNDAHVLHENFQRKLVKKLPRRFKIHNKKKRMI